MKRIAKYQTNDGHLFDTREEAARHIDAQIGAITSRISHALVTKKVERDRGLGPRQPQDIQRVNRP